MRAPPRVPLPVHRRRGTLRGFVDGDRLFDLCGQQTGWIEPVFGRSPDVFDLTNRFLGELPAREPRIPLDDRSDALPCPLSSPGPPAR